MPPLGTSQVVCSGWRGPPCQFAIDVTIGRTTLSRCGLVATVVVRGSAGPLFISGLRMRSADKKKLSAGLQVSKIDKA